MTTFTRRQFTLAALLGTTAALALRGAPALAQPKQIVLANWGGDATAAYEAAYGKPFAEETGIALLQDGAGPTEGAIAAQVQSGKPAWDVVDVDAFSAQTLGKQGLMIPIDYNVVDKTKVREGFTWEFAVGSYMFSYILAWDATRYDTPPTSMADFFDLEKFPGKRTMYKWGTGMWEAALLADGVPMDQLYPLDIERAHAKIAAIKPEVVAFWGNGTESQQLLMEGEAGMALIWSTRARLIEQDTGGDITFTWNQGMISPGALGVLANNPAGPEVAMQFIASAQDPAKQKVMFDMLNQAGANPATDALIPEDERRYNAMDPENAAVQVVLDMGWYEANYTAALDAYLALVSS